MPGRQETKSERAANRRAGERVVSLEVEVGDFGVINPRTNFIRGKVWPGKRYRAGEKAPAQR